MTITGTLEFCLLCLEQSYNSGCQKCQRKSASLRSRREYHNVSIELTDVIEVQADVHVTHFGVIAYEGENEPYSFRISEKLMPIVTL